MKLRFLLPFFVNIPAFALFATDGSGLSFTLLSKSIHDGERLNINQVYDGMGAGGKNLSPELSWTNVPEKARSLAITIYDPDAPTGSGWWHWVVFNIPVSVSSLPEGASMTAKMPEACTESMTDFGKPGFGGAAPPPGDKPHHYIVTLWALDIDHLDLGMEAPAAQVGFNLNHHAIAKATITGLYSR